MTVGPTRVSPLAESTTEAPRAAESPGRPASVRRSGEVSPSGASGRPLQSARAIPRRPRRNSSHWAWLRLTSSGSELSAGESTTDASKRGPSTRLLVSSGRETQPPRLVVSAPDGPASVLAPPDVGADSSACWPAALMRRENPAPPPSSWPNLPKAADAEPQGEAPLPKGAGGRGGVPAAAPSLAKGGVAPSEPDPATDRRDKDARPAPAPRGADASPAAWPSLSARPASMRRPPARRAAPWRPGCCVVEETDQAEAGPRELAEPGLAALSEMPTVAAASPLGGRRRGA
mmetsp:Transcript_18062/g.68213  ORF Transcript_18062/g.68213 Transcript_18062/m.68213 type:complete len:289 (+) Transcript_18062:1054-1920(+)